MIKLMNGIVNNIDIRRGGNENGVTQRYQYERDEHEMH